MFTTGMVPWMTIGVYAAMTFLTYYMLIRGFRKCQFWWTLLMLILYSIPMSLLLFFGLTGDLMLIAQAQLRFAAQNMATQAPAA